MKKYTTICIMSLMLFFAGVVSGEKYSGGKGVEGSPYQISTIEDWQDLMKSPGHWASHFVLTDDLNFKGLKLAPVGDAYWDWSGDDPVIVGVPFTGVVDGGGYVISNFVIDQPDDSEVGLFGWIGDGVGGGHIHNLGLENFSVVGDEFVGCLAGRSYRGTITDSYAYGDVSGNEYVGGLCGTNGGVIERSYAVVEVTGVSYCGGLVGQHSTGQTIKNSYAMGDVDGSNHIGGLLGRNLRGRVINCYSTGEPAGSDFVGGLVGSADATGDYEDTGNFWDTETSEVTDSAMGSGKDTEQMHSRSTFIDAGWDFGSVWYIVSPDYPDFIGERVYSGGQGSAEQPYIIADPFDWFQLTARPDDWDKHFILVNDIDFEGAELTPVGRVSYACFGGVFDGQGYVIRDAVIHFPEKYGVGLFGYLGRPTDAYTYIRNLRLENISVEGDISVGALVGTIKGGCVIVDGVIVDNCHAHNVTVSGNWHVGGLVGRMSGDVIRRSSATGTVSIPFARVGGLVGTQTSHSKITDCYAICSVRGHEKVGGLIGAVRGGKVKHCFSGGRVRATSLTSIGGLVGHAGGWGYETEDVGNFWDVQTSQMNQSAMGTGRTTAEMKTQSTFTDAEWDFINMWGIGQDHTYPYHRTTPIADLDGDGSVDMMDFAIFAEQWLIDNE